jgi:DNA helicase HerA-like ATPase
MVEKESVFKIGEVYSVDGRKIKIKVDKNKNVSYIFYQGRQIKNVVVGSYIKILKGYVKIIAKVESEYIEEDKFINENYYQREDKIKRFLIVSLLGFFENGQFKRGIKELPLVFNECYLLDEYEFKQVHNFLSIDKDRVEDSIQIGKLALEENQPIEISINKLFASHIGIFGNTGSGKSYTLAKLYHELINKYKNYDKFLQNVEFYIFDFNGEYLINDKRNDNVIIESEYKNTYILDTKNVKDKFPLTKKVIEDINFWAIYLHATEKTQIPFLKRAFRINIDFENFREYIINFIMDLLNIGIDKNDIENFLFEISKVLNIQSQIYELIDLISKFQWHSSHNVYYIQIEEETYYCNNNKAITKIRQFINDKTPFLDVINHFQKIALKILIQFYYEKKDKYTNMEFISPLIKRVRRIKYLEKVIDIVDEITERKVLNIISLKDVNQEMKKILPLIISKYLYDDKKEKMEKEKYLNIIIDEAHNILSPISNRESEQWKEYRLETFEEIIKEGRKFGVFLTIASQRPSDISSTIISQLHNYFLHKLINNKDIEAIERTVSYLDKVSFEYLSILPTGTCIFAGLAAQIPIIIAIDKIKNDYEPKNDTIKLTENWKSD